MLRTIPLSYCYSKEYSSFQLLFWRMILCDSFKSLFWRIYSSILSLFWHTWSWFGYSSSILWIFRCGPSSALQPYWRSRHYHQSTVTSYTLDPSHDVMHSGSVTCMTSCTLDPSQPSGQSLRCYPSLFVSTLPFVRVLLFIETTDVSNEILNTRCQNSLQICTCLHTDSNGVNNLITLFISWLIATSCSDYPLFKAALMIMKRRVKRDLSDAFDSIDHFFLFHDRMVYRRIVQLHCQDNNFIWVNNKFSLD